MKAKDMPLMNVTSPNVGMIDFITDFNDRVYIANRGNWMRSTTSLPSDADWVACAPSAAAYTAKTSVLTSNTSEILPQEKAVPQMAEFKNQLNQVSARRRSRCW